VLGQIESYSLTSGWPSDGSTVGQIRSEEETRRHGQQETHFGKQHKQKDSSVLNPLKSINLVSW